MINFYNSTEDPRFNTAVLRNIYELTSNMPKCLVHGWRCCIEMQDSKHDEPFYQLDLQNEPGAGEFAPIKMQMLHLCPTIRATGNNPLHILIDGLENVNFDEKLVAKIPLREALLQKLASLDNVNEITDETWDQLKEFGLTRWYGAIRIPYQQLRTLDAFNGPTVNPTSGEIRISFSGAKEWQDTFFCFNLFQHIQAIVHRYWDLCQISYDLNWFGDPVLGFWIDALQIKSLYSENNLKSASPLLMLNDLR